MVTGLRHHRTERGQSLIVAVIVMFVLFFLGAIFVGLVARNLFNAGRAQDTLSALEFAQAGIRNAEYNLQNSPDGADWRPAPTPAVDPNDPDKLWLDQGYSRVDYGRGRALVRVTYQPQLAIDPQDPTKTILDPNSKYVKIEAVGRFGFLDARDPTTFLNSPTPRLRRELIAYKAIGLTDYGLFVTNLNNEAKFEAAVGLPPMGVMAGLQLGGLPVRTFGNAPTSLQTVDFPMRVNGDLRIHTNTGYPAESNPATATNPAPSVVFQANRVNSGSILVSGKIIGDDPLRHAIFNDPSTNVGGNIFGSDEVDANGNSLFDTYFGRVRDGGAVPDVKGYARAIPVLPGPHIDAIDPGTNTTRYLAASRDSGRWLGPVGNSFNTGRFGAGAGFYIDNFNNTESETQNIAGGQSLRSIWLHQGATPQYWQGPYLVPPGVYIEFGYPVVQTRDANGNLEPASFAPRPGFRVIRDANDRAFRDPNGNIAPGEMDFVFFIYKAAGQKPVIKLENEFFRTFMRTTLNLTEAQIDAFWPAFNGVIYAEGNIRTRGLVPSKANMQIRRGPGADPDNLTDAQVRDDCDIPAVTMVSGNANIYLEGSLVREPFTDSTGAGMPGSMVALLAQNSVVVNTTLFLRPSKVEFTPFDLNGQSLFYKDIDTADAASTPPFSLDFMFGDNPGGYTLAGGGAPTINLLVRHAAQAAPSFLQLLINQQLAGQNPAYLFNANAAPFGELNPPPADYVLQNPASQVYPVFEQTQFPLLPKPNGSAYAFFTTPGIRNQIRPALDPNPPASGASQDYYFSAAAVSPMDVRIEAVMYAQNGSFFVVPGLPINTNPGDTRDAAHRRAVAAGFTGATDMIRPAGTTDYYPFYGEPFDCRVTVVGAISENRTASVADQSAWMQLWGYIPEVNGSTGHDPQTGSTTEVLAPDQHVRITDVGLPVPATDPRTPQEQAARLTRGLRIIYDPYLDAPYAGYQPPNPPGVPTGQPAVVKMPGGWARTVAFGTARQDDFGRPLPPVARMPVCPGFVFYGEVR